MVSMIPEQEIFLDTFASIAGASGGNRTITLNATFVGNFSLVTNLYVGCVLEIYADSGDVFTDKTVVVSNTANTITVSDTLDTNITSSASSYYGVLRQFGSPVPAPKGGSATTHTAQVLTVEFKSDTASDYNDVGIIFGVLDGAGGTNRDAGIFFTSDGSFANAAGLLTETEYDITVDISGSELTTAEEYIDAAIAAINLVDVDEGDAGTDPDFTAVRDGNKLILTNIYGGSVFRTPGTDDGGSDSTIGSLDIASTSVIELTVTTAGATESSSNPRLLSDTWIGLADSITVPTTSVEMKQLNLASAGTRNYIYQFKGAESTDGGSINLFANNFSFLYYALGKKAIGAVGGEASTVLTNEHLVSSSDNDLSGTNFIFDDTSSDTTDRFYRCEDNTICPPIRKGIDDTTGIKRVGTAATNFITYTYSEENGEELPSFALEYTLKKGSQLSTVAVDTPKEAVYSKIYPGCQVNTLSITADEGQEIKMDVSLMTKTTVVADTNYDTFNGETDVQNFVNYGSRAGGAAGQDDGLMTPYFFSDGTIEMFGNEYIRIQNCTLTINNGLQDKRYIGRTNKTIKTMVTGQRTYELSFTGYVTDDAIFEALRNDTVYGLQESDNQDIKLNFYKANGEQVQLHFRNYVVKTADFPLTNDNSPISVSWTIEPLTLAKAEEKTYWVIQG